MSAVLVLPIVLFLPIAPVTTFAGANDWQILVPRLEGGHPAGRVAFRVSTVTLPSANTGAFVEGLALRTGVAVTRTHGLRLEIVLPPDVEFTSIRAHVADGLVLGPASRGVASRVGHALLGVLRILLFGQLVSAADDLAIPGAAWAVALGAPEVDEELVRLNSSNVFFVERGQRAFTDHGDFVVCRAMMAYTPWTELVGIELRGFDRRSGDDVRYTISRLPLAAARRPPAEPLPIARAVSFGSGPGP